jgi:hypothetical protein
MCAYLARPDPNNPRRRSMGTSLSRVLAGADPAFWRSPGLSGPHRFGSSRGWLGEVAAALPVGIRGCWRAEPLPISLGGVVCYQIR